MWPGIKQVGDRVGRARALGAALLLTAGLGINLFALHSLKMDRFSSYWVKQALPAAVNAEFGYRYDYTGLVGVYDRMNEVLKKDVTYENPTALLDASVRHALEHRSDSLDRTHYRVSTDDKGFIDLVKVSFSLFGYRTRYVVLCYWAILAASSLLFAVRFGGRREAMFLLLAYLLAHCAVLPCVAFNPQLRNVISPRFLCVLGFVPTMHLMLEVLFRRKQTPLSVVSLVLQALVLVLVYHMRVSVAWQMAAVLLCVLVTLVRGLLLRPAAPGDGGRAGLFLPGAVSLVSLAAGLLLLSGYERATYSPLYSRGGGGGHVFWHTLYSGLAYQPKLAKEYELHIDDNSIIVAAHRFLTARGREDEWRALKGPGDPLSPAINYDKYDRVVREMFFATCRQRPWEVVSALAYYKPASLVKYVAWHCRIIKTAPDIDVLWGGAQEELTGMASRMDREGKCFELWRWDFLGLLLLFGCWARSDVLRYRNTLLAVALLLFAGSVVTSLIGYPSAHTLGEVLISLGMLIYLAGVVVVAKLLSLVFPPGTKAAEGVPAGTGG